MNLATLAFMCVTQLPTTSFIARTQGDDVMVRVVHHNGPEYMPIHEGIVVPHDLESLKQRAEVMKRLGSDMEFRFSLKDCQRYGEGLMACKGNDRQEINGLSVEAWTLSVSAGIDHFRDYTFEHHNVMLGLEIEGLEQSAFISMRYQPGDCEFEF